MATTFIPVSTCMLFVMRERQVHATACLLGCDCQPLRRHCNIDPSSRWPSRVHSNVIWQSIVPMCTGHVPLPWRSTENRTCCCLPPCTVGGDSKATHETQGLFLGGGGGALALRQSSLLASIVCIYHHTHGKLACLLAPANEAILVILLRLAGNETMGSCWMPNKEAQAWPAWTE